MVMPGNKAYEVKCRSCSWQKTEIISQLIPLPATVIRTRFNSKCPNCKGKITAKKNKNVLF